MGACTLLQVGALKAAARLHMGLLKRIMRAPMSFFDTTPTGRILNRFTKDVDIADLTIPINLRSTFTNFFNVLGTLIVICVAIPFFTFAVIPLAILFYFVQKFYVASARQVKRMESITRSPMYSHFGETLSGAPTIRAYGMLPTFIDENERHVDFNQVRLWITKAADRGSFI